MRSCERPRKRSGSEALPSSVSNRYSLSIRTHGSSCRRRARSWLRRVSSFSASSSSSRAASHSLRVPVLCFVIALGPLLLAGARPRLRVRPFHDRPHLDAPQARGRDLRGYLDGVVQIPGLDQIEPAQLLLRLGEGPVRGERLAVLDPDGRSRLNGLEGIRGNVVPALPENLVIVQRLVNAGVHLVLRQGVPVVLVYVDQAQVLHGFLLSCGGKATNSRSEPIRSGSGSLRELLGDHDGTPFSERRRSGSGRASRPLYPGRGRRG